MDFCPNIVPRSIWLLHSPLGNKSDQTTAQVSTGFIVGEEHIAKAQSGATTETALDLAAVTSKVEVPSVNSLKRSYLPVDLDRPML